MRHPRLAKTFRLALALLAAAPAAAAAQSREPMSDAELDDARGGYLVANGVTFGFGLVMRSYVDDQLALQTRLTWTETGPVTERTSAAGSVALSDAIDGLLASGIDLRGLTGADGVVVAGDGGTTTLVHNIAPGQLQNLILNSASNRSLRQEIEVSLTLPDLAAMQRGFSLQQFTGRIGGEMGLATARATLH